jgi:hypothetical protein
MLIHINDHHEIFYKPMLYDIKQENSFHHLLIRNYNHQLLFVARRRIDFYLKIFRFVFTSNTLR